MTPPTPEAVTLRSLHRASWLVFALLLLSYAFFWQPRDWNTASRLMLTYALVDRGTIQLDGLNDQTRDIAFFDGHFYTDKLPGLSLLAVPAYAAAKAIFRYPDHPLATPGLVRLEGDYWATLGTSGLATAILGAWLVRFAGRLGCSPRRAGFIGLGYGLATPAYVYATHAYGHQVTALALFAALALLATPGVAPSLARIALAGLAVGVACLVELQAAPASAVLGGIAVAQSWRLRRFDGIVAFGLGGLGPLLVLLGYNVLAFGSPFDMGYFHHATPQFARVHSRSNPLGLVPPDPSVMRQLLVGGFRGITFYAPLVAFAPLGWWRLGRDRRRALLLGTLGICLAFYAVNISYPEWTGGWSTGPRLLLPAVPFALIATSAWIAQARRVGLLITGAAALFGFGLMTLFAAVGGQVPQDMPSPLFDYVWPQWANAADPQLGRPMTSTVLDLFSLLSAAVAGSDPRAPFLGLAAVQSLAILLILGSSVSGARRKLDAPAGPTDRLATLETRPPRGRPSSTRWRDILQRGTDPPRNQGDP